MDRLKVGIATFLLSEAFFFLMIVLVYVWFHGESGEQAESYLDLPLAMTLTGLLLSSSVTIALAVRSLKKGSKWGLRAWLGATLLLGAAFLGTQGYEWTGLFRHRIFPSQGLFGSTFFTLTGFHGLHVFSGLIVLGSFFTLSAMGRLDERHVNGFEAASLYWHFVDAVWIVILSVVYLWALA